ncbi:unnamed protein product [Protopolystoma xenopodis]|uniref:Uncharacterized protein n=1 Tax=Protopolystoma xenopodis TaxID=117903 RepID=A0A448XP11_9PLAT|nr:unnamed protein product [Protopolystoma xenopodis]
MGDITCGIYRRSVNWRGYILSCHLVAKSLIGGSAAWGASPIEADDGPAVWIAKCLSQTLTGSQLLPRAPLTRYRCAGRALAQCPQTAADTHWTLGPILREEQMPRSDPTRTAREAVSQASLIICSQTHPIWPTAPGVEIQTQLSAFEPAAEERAPQLALANPTLHTHRPGSVGLQPHSQKAKLTNVSIR